MKKKSSIEIEYRAMSEDKCHIEMIDLDIIFLYFTLDEIGTLDACDIVWCLSPLCTTFTGVA